MFVSALRGRNCVEFRESGLTGGEEEREVYRYDSSAGENAKEGIVVDYIEQETWTCNRWWRVLSFLSPAVFKGVDARECELKSRL